METNKKGAGNVSVNECTYFDEDDDDDDDDEEEVDDDEEEEDEEEEEEEPRFSSQSKLFNFSTQTDASSPTPPWENERVMLRTEAATSSKSSSADTIFSISSFA